MTCELCREWLAELVQGLKYDDNAVTWILRALRQAEKKKRFEVDSLSDVLSQFVAGLPLPLLPKLIASLQELLEKPPVIERRYCEISMHYSWLLRGAGEAVVRLIEARDTSALNVSTLSILRKLPAVREYGDLELRDIRGDLPKLVGDWPALNHALFWQDVAETRVSMDIKKGERLTEFWHVGVLGHYWSFGPDAFDAICDDIGSRPLLDDRLVALTLAFAIYRQSGRPAGWRNRLKRLAYAEPQLKAALDGLLRPPAKGRQRWRAQDQRWRRRAAREAAREEGNKQRWKKHLEEHIATIRDSGKPGVVNNAQYYLHQQMRDDSDKSNKWTEGKWRSLIPSFGEPIARAFRDGAVVHWRGYCPKLRSEGAAVNSTPFSVIFGLTGLSIESREEPDWLKKLSPADTEVATRFAMYELNGFPTWLPSVYDAFPDVVVKIVMGEIEHELATEDPKSESHDVLHDASWYGEWMWERLAPLIFERLRRPPKGIANLRYLLAVVQGSSIDDATVAKLAAQKAKGTKNLTTAPMWFAVWVGVDPAAAIPALMARLVEIPKDADKTLFAMRFITCLLGGRRQGPSARQAYRTVEHMKSLYLLMHQYVREKDDIERAGKGVYSPELRDEAQDARNALFSFIRETPGKEAFLALMDISRAHPEESSRPWMAFHAKAKAALDAGAPSWSPSQVRDFHDKLERTPANHRDLWYLAVDRLLNLKNDLEEGDASIASILQPIDRETEIRKYIGNWCREKSGGRYVIPQEEELADAKRPDLRFHGVGFDGPVPVELKLADKWTGPRLLERLEIQLCGDYLRDKRSSRGIFGLVYHGTKRSWDLPNGKRAESFTALVEALQNHWTHLANQFPGIEDIRVIGIDLTKRGIDAKTAATGTKTRRAGDKPAAKTSKASKAGVRSKVPTPKSRRKKSTKR